jgi:hypothetical protein
VSRRDPQLRARDQDRDATVEQIEAAYEQPIDLRDLNVKALFENTQKARRVLNVDHGALTHVNLTSSPFDEGPVANIYVSNEAQESGYLRTALNGRVIRPYPF